MWKDEPIAKERPKMEFLHGVWSAIQSLVNDWDEPTIAREIARANHINKKLAAELQKGTEYYDPEMAAFIRERIIDE